MEEAAEQVDPTELFRELLRIFPTAKLDDYYKNGAWKVDTILIDTELIEAHRLEAGAPEPPALEEVQLPEITSRGWHPAAGRKPPPAPAAPLRHGSVVPAAPLRPGLVSPPKPLGVVTPKPPLIRPTAFPKPTGVVFPQPAKAPAAAGGGGGALSSELRQIATFIAKWKCDATKTKLLLARLTPANRKVVIESFDHSDTSVTSTAAFEKFVQDFERGEQRAGTGDDTEPVAPSPGAAKRPSPAEAFSSEAKRPKMAVATPKTGAPLTTPKHLTTPKSSAPGRSAGIGAVPKGKAAPKRAPALLSGNPPVSKPPAAKTAAPKPAAAKPPAIKPTSAKTVTESRRSTADARPREGYGKEPEAAPGQLIQNLLSLL